VIPDDKKAPTLGLLAGTTSVYCAQFAFAGARRAVGAGRNRNEAGRIHLGEVVVAGMVCKGIVIWMVVAPDATVCSAERLTVDCARGRAIGSRHKTLEDGRCGGAGLCDQRNGAKIRSVRHVQDVVAL